MLGSNSLTKYCRMKTGSRGRRPYSKGELIVEDRGTSSHVVGILNRYEGLSQCPVLISMIVDIILQVIVLLSGLLGFVPGGPWFLCLLFAVCHVFFLVRSVSSYARRLRCVIEVKTSSSKLVSSALFFTSW